MAQLYVELCEYLALVLTRFRQHPGVASDLTNLVNFANVSTIRQASPSWIERFNATSRIYQWSIGMFTLDVLLAIRLLIGMRTQSRRPSARSELRSEISNVEDRVWIP